MLFVLVIHDLFLDVCIVDKFRREGSYVHVNGVYVYLTSSRPVDCSNLPNYRQTIFQEYYDNKII